MKKNFKYYMSLIKERKIIFSLVFFMLLSFGLIKIVFMENFYGSYATIEIAKYEGGKSVLDSLNNTRHRVNSPTDEAEIIKSSSLIEKVVNLLNLSMSYYSHDGILKDEVDESEFPYTIKYSSKNSQNVVIKLIPNTQKDVKFEISYKDPLSKFLGRLGTKVPFIGNEKNYEGTFTFGIEQKVGPYTITVDKKDETSLTSTYSFSYTNPKSIAYQARRNLIVVPIIKDSSIIGITYKDKTPVRAKKFIEKLLELYSHQNLAVNTKRVMDAIAVVKQQLVEKKLSLDTSTKLLEEYQTNNLLLNVSDEFANGEKEISKLTAEKSAIILRKKVYEKILKSILKDQDIGNIVVDDAGIMNLVALRDDAIAKQKELLGKYTKKHAKVIANEQKIESMRQMLNEKIIYLLGNITTREDTLTNLIENLKIKVKDLPAKEAHLSELKRKYITNSEIYQELLKSKMKMSTEVVKAQQYNRVIDKPNYSDDVVYPKRFLLILITLILSAIGAFIAVLLQNILDGVIKKPQDILRISKIPLFGIVPFIQSKNYNKIFLLDKENTHVIESFRKIRTNLEYAGNTDKGKVVLVTSSVSNEGKTTFAANLAVIHAMLNKKVVIVNLDLRIPQLHMKFGIENTFGMSEILAGKATVNEVKYSYDQVNKDSVIHHLDIITSGAIPPNPAELIDSAKLDEILTELRNNYDTIIIDSPPMKVASESFVLAKKSDVVLYVLKSESSKIENLEYLEKVSKEFTSKSLGIVLVSIQEKYMEMPVYDKNYAMFVSKKNKEKQ